MSNRCASKWLVVLALSVVGCGVDTQGKDDAGGTGARAGTSSGGVGGSSAGGADTGGQGGGSGGSTTGGATGVGFVVIDVQESFVNGSVTPDMPGIIDRTKQVFTLASEKSVPFFLTFEDSQHGDHALHAPLQPVLPAHAKTFTKTTFAATGLPAFASSVQESGLSHLAVFGAETDVCVLQTVLGLRQLGLSVVLAQDAVFTSESNTAPALRRMQQAGVQLASTGEIAGYVADPTQLASVPSAEVRIVDPLHLGVVLNDFTDSSIGSLGDPLVSQKSARLRELLLVSEWFEIPVYSSDPSALPASFASYFKGQLRPVGQIGSDGFVTQLVFAGTDGGLTEAMKSWSGTHALFVMEDALLARGTPEEQEQLLAPFFDSGLVPTTYKSFYYEMTRSVSLGEWPSQKWVERFDEYYWITQAPEDLPPIDGA